MSWQRALAQRALAAGCAVGALVALAAAVTRSRRVRSSRGQLQALREALKLRQALQHKLGLDIGGTLAKIVFAIDPAAAGERTAVREIVTWNDVTTMHDELSFTARSGGFAFAFIETPTETLEETARAIAATVQYPENTAYREIIATGGGAHRFYDMFRSVLQAAADAARGSHTGPRPGPPLPPSPCTRAAAPTVRRLS